MELVFRYGNLLPAYTQAGPSYEILAPGQYFPADEQTEIAIDLEDCARGLEKLREIVVDKKIPVNLITEVCL